MHNALFPLLSDTEKGYSPLAGANRKAWEIRRPAFPSGAELITGEGARLDMLGRILGGPSPE
jgi:hypothetical protein